jgi:hypothetical protein
VVGQHDPGGSDIEQLDAAGRQDLQEVDDIEVIDQGVRQLYEGLCETLLPIHCRTSLSCGVLSSRRTCALTRWSPRRI